MQWKRRPLSCEYALKAEPNRHTFIFSFLIDGFIRPLPPDEHLSKKQQKTPANLPFLARCGNKTTSFVSLQNAYLSTSTGCWAVGGGSKTDRWDWRRARALFRGHVLLPPGCHSPGRPPPRSPFRLYLPYVCTNRRAFPRVPSDVPRQSWSRLPRLFLPPRRANGIIRRM